MGRRLSFEKQHSHPCLSHLFVTSFLEAEACAIVLSTLPSPLPQRPPRRIERRRLSRAPRSSSIPRTRPREIRERERDSREREMETGTERVAGPVLFSDEELGEISGVRSGGGEFVEVTCGCTSHRYGDAVGRLRVFASGELQISCDCTPGCQEDKLTPAAFEKHSGRETAKKWKSNVWVIVKGEKVPLAKTVLLRYYNQTSKAANGSHKGPNGRLCHRDEFVRCKACNKDRRFRLRTKDECRIYHDALADSNWKCSDLPFDKITCDDEEERASRKVLRGCSRSPSCKGCTSCVCFGCNTCRFSDCSCQTCVDFTRNMES